MTTVDNAVALMSDPVLFDKVKAVSVFTARGVVIEAAATPNHAVRLGLAKVVIYDPNQHANRFQNIIACDDSVASAYTTGSAIPDNVLIQKMSDLWTPVAQMLNLT